MSTIIRLTESDLHQIVKEAVKDILIRESYGTFDGLKGYAQKILNLIDKNIDDSDNFEFNIYFPYNKQKNLRVKSMRMGIKARIY